MTLGVFRLNTLARFQEVISSIETDAGVFFDQTDTQHLGPTAVSSSRSAGKYITVSFWTRNQGNYTGTNTFISANTTNPPTNNAANLSMYITSDANQMLRLYMYNTSTAQLVVDIRTQLRAMIPNTWSHILFVVDTTSQANTKIYVDGVEQGVTYTALVNQNTGVEQTASLQIGADIRTNTNRLTGQIAQIWIDDSYIDPSANLAKFYDDGFVDLGATGTSSGLSQPMLYLVGEGSDFYTNRGTGTNFTVTDFTATGSVQATSSKPSAGESWAINRYSGYVPRFNNASISTTTGKFNQSLYMNNSNLDRGIYYTQFDNDTFNSLTTWTIEGFIRWDTAFANTSRTLINGPAGAIYLRAFTASYVLEYNLGGVNWNGSVTTGTTLGIWHHWAIEKNGNSEINIYVDGSRVSARTNNLQNAFTSNSTVNLWLAGSMFDYMDEIRISKVARYAASSYTVPTSAFTNDSNTMLLLHFNGTNGSTTFTDDF